MRNGKGRSLQTYQNKIKKLEIYYNNLFKTSQKRKQKETKQGFLYFFERYPSFESFKEKIKIKEVTQR